MYNLRKKLSLLIILLSSLALNQVFATNYTVSSASELNNLSLSAGDVVTMTNGVWSNQELEFKGEGTADNPITLKAETQGEVILTGFSRLEMSGEYLVVDGLTFKDGELEGDAVVAFRTSSSSYANNSRLTNTAIIDYNPWDPAEEYKWVSVYGVNNQVDHCSFVGKNHAGALLVIWIGETANYHRINNNYFADIPELGDNGAEAIRIGTSTNSMKDSYATVEHNLFENCDGEIEIISNKSCENIYRYNTFLHCEGTLTLRHGNRCSVYGNFFFGDLDKKSGGVRIIGEDHKVYNNYFQDLTSDGFRSAISITNGVPDSPLNRYFQVKNAEVLNNTIVNCKYGITLGAGADDELSLAPQNVSIINNVLVDYVGRTQKAVDYEDTPESISYSNNIFYASKLGDTPDEVDNSDPLLEDVNGFYRPKDNSPVIGFGLNTFDYMTSDIEGQSRSGSNDAGCDQVSTDDALYGPLSAEDVGELIGVTYADESADNTEIDEDSIPQLTIISAIASTEENEGDKYNVAANVLDSDFSTRWSGEGIGAYIDLNLEAQSIVAYIKVGHYKGDERSSSFHLLGWNIEAEAFDTLLSSVNSVISTESLTTYDFEDYVTDKVRLVGLGYDYGSGVWNSYTEFELYGWPNGLALSVSEPVPAIELYPNPTRGAFFLRNCTEGKLNIYTLSGKQVFSLANVQSDIPIVTHLEKGIYLVKVDTAFATLTQKLILI